MAELAAAFLVFACYGVGALMLTPQALRRGTAVVRAVFTLGLGAHTLWVVVVLWPVLSGVSSLNLGQFIACGLWVLALTAWLVRANGQATRGARLFAWVLALSVVLPHALAGVELIAAGAPASLMIHVLCSLLGVGVALVGLSCAWLSRVQSALFKRDAASPVLAWLPPLLILESAVFILIWQGFILLALALVSGFWVWPADPSTGVDIKLGASLAAWGVFCFLLWGRWNQGLRAARAAGWMALVVLLLVLASFVFHFLG